MAERGTYNNIYITADSTLDTPVLSVNFDYIKKAVKSGALIYLLNLVETESSFTYHLLPMFGAFSDENGCNVTFIDLGEGNVGQYTAADPYSVMELSE